MAKSKSSKDGEKSKKDKDSKKDSEIKLAQKLSIGNAKELEAMLLEGLESGDEITLNMSDVEQVDTAAIQVLIGFINSATKAKCAFKWRGESEALTNFSKALALNSNLDFSAGAMPEAELCPVF